MVFLLLTGLAGCGGDSGGTPPPDGPEPDPPSILTDTLPDGTVDVEYSATLSATSGLPPPFTWSVSAGSLPDGLSLDSESGEISGTPTTEGTFTFTIQVTDSMDRTDSQEFTVAIGAATPLVELVNVSSDGTRANGDSGTPAVSGQGRFVAFTSFATNLVSNDTNGVADVFLRDRGCGETIRVSVASDGTEPGSQSFSPATSSVVNNTLFVAYVSDANNLVPNDGNTARDVFVTAVDVSSCPPDVLTTARVSLADDSSEANSNSQLPSITPDGRFVVYQSFADNFSEADANNVPDIFVTEVDFTGGVLTPLSTRRHSTFKVRLAIDPDVSNTTADIFSKNTIGNSNLDMAPDEHQGREVEIVDGTGANQIRRITMHDETTFTVSPNWQPVPDDTSVFRVVTREDQTVVTAGPDSVSNSVLAMTEDEHVGQNRFVAIVAGTGAGQKRAIVGNDANSLMVDPEWTTTPGTDSEFRVLQEPNVNASRGRISSDGAVVGFNTRTGFETGDTNGLEDVFLHERDSAITNRVSVSNAGALSEGSSQISDLSPDGNLVLFQSSGADLVPDDTNAQSDLFIRDRSLQETSRVTLANDGSEPDAFTDVVAGLSGGGRLVAFSSAAENLVPDDRNIQRDVFLRDRQAGETRRLSLGLGGINPDGASFDADISLDGTTVAFASEATNLVLDDTNDVRDIFVAVTGVSDPAIIVSSRLPQPQAGVPYSGSLVAVGGTGALFWTLQEGALPPGLFLDPLSGEISGIPQKPGRFRFTMLVMDSGRPVRRAARTFTLTVAP